MPITVKIGRVRRLRKDVVAEWREQPTLDLSRQIEDYCQSWGFSRLLWRCPHGVYLANDPENFAPYCSECVPLLFDGKPGRRIGAGLWINTTQPGRLDKFPRTGYRNITTVGYIDWHENEPFYMPPDHYVSPYDERLRCRKPEMSWYYVPGESGDGIGVRAKLGWGETLEGDLRQHGRSLSEDEAEGIARYGPRFRGSWYYTAEDISRLKAYFFPRFRSVGLSLAPNAIMGDSVIAFFDDERNAMEWQGEYRRIGDLNWTDRKPQVKRTQKSTPKQAPKCTAEKNLTAAEKALDLSGRWWERWNGSSWTQTKLSDKDVKRWRVEHWSTRAVYQPPPTRRPWVNGWQTERKMRDLAARLDMYRYGDGAVQPVRMMQAARLNAEAAQAVFNAAHGVTVAQCPPKHEREPSIRHRETVPLSTPAFS